MKQQPYKYVVRLPADMRDLIAESAQFYRRSMNSDIVARLQQSFRGLPALDNAQPSLNAHFDTLFRQDLSEQEAELIQSIRRLSQIKRDALQRLLL